MFYIVGGWVSFGGGVWVDGTAVLLQQQLYCTAVLLCMGSLGFGGWMA